MELEQRSPTFSSDFIINNILPRFYNLSISSSSLTPLPSERDQNFLIANGSEKYVLKISNGKEERKSLEMQNKLMNHLHSQIGSPQKVIPTLLKDEIGVVEYDGKEYMIRLLSYVEGMLFAKSLPHNLPLLYSLGRYLGHMSEALSSFQHESANRYLKWDLKESLWARSYVDYIKDNERKSIATSHFDRFEKYVLPKLPALRKSIIHNDANDYNIIVGPKNVAQKEVVAIIDFGDVVYSNTIFELSIALAYSILDQVDPLQAAAEVVRGYHEVYPLLESEVDLLFTLVCTRLSVSVTNSAYQQTIEPDNKYLVISEAPAWKCLFQLNKCHPNLAHFLFRKACKVTPYCVSSDKVTKWIQNNQSQFAHVLGFPLTENNSTVSL